MTARDHFGWVRRADEHATPRGKRARRAPGVSVTRQDSNSAPCIRLVPTPAASEGTHPTATPRPGKFGRRPRETMCGAWRRGHARPRPSAVGPRLAKSLALAALAVGAAGVHTRAALCATRDAAVGNTVHSIRFRRLAALAPRAGLHACLPTARLNVRGNTYIFKSFFFPLILHFALNDVSDSATACTEARLCLPAWRCSGGVTMQQAAGAPVSTLCATQRLATCVCNSGGSALDERNKGVSPILKDSRSASLHGSNADLPLLHAEVASSVTQA